MAGYLHDPVDIAAGATGYKSVVNKFGRNAASASGDGLWAASTAFPDVSTITAGVATVSSGDAADDGDPVGTGARTVVLQGLDGDKVPATATVVLDGTTGVPTTQVFSRINRMYVTTAGSGRVNAGIITATIGGVTVATIAAGRNQTEMAWYTVPAGKTAQIVGVSCAMVASGGAARSAEIDLSRTAGEDSTVILPLQTYALTTVGTNSNQADYSAAPILVDEKLDIFLICQTNASGGALHGAFDVILRSK